MADKPQGWEADWERYWEDRKGTLSLIQIENATGETVAATFMYEDDLEDARTQIETEIASQWKWHGWR